MQQGDFAVILRSGFRDWVADIVSFGTRSPAYHAVLAVGGNQLVEAMPGGAALAPIDKYGDRAVWSSFVMTDTQRQHVVDAGTSYLGTPYNWLDDATLGISRFFRFHPPRWIWALLSRGHKECAQLVDAAYLEAGVHLFDDGRIPGDVTPADLYSLIEVSS